MRFLLDNDVDARVAKVLRRHGHDCWTASEAGLAGVIAASDDHISVYAADKDAVVVTHDQEFSRRRLSNTYGKHLWLRCEQPDATHLIGTRLDEIVTALRQHVDVVVIASQNGIEANPPRWI